MPTKKKKAEEEFPGQVIQEAPAAPPIQPPAPRPAPPATLEGLLTDLSSDTKSELDALFSDEHLSKKAELTPRQVAKFAVASTLADRYQSSLLKNLLHYQLTYSISKKRKGREEFVESLRLKILEPLAAQMKGLRGMLGGSNDAPGQ